MDIWWGSLGGIRWERLGSFGWLLGLAAQVSRGDGAVSLFVVERSAKLCKDFHEVGFGVELVDFAVFDEGGEEGGVSAGFGAAEEEGVSEAKLEGAEGVFEAALERVRWKRSGSFIGLAGLGIFALQEGFFQFLM